MFAGPRGSGKTTAAKFANIIEPYINANEIKKSNFCSNIEAAQIAEDLRNKLIDEKKSFTFETMLSTERNLFQLKRAKSEGFFIQCIYVLTADPAINISRVAVRTLFGEYYVPDKKVVERYEKSLNLIPRMLNICDVCSIYDNSSIPFLIFKKRSNGYNYWENEFWNIEKIKRLVDM